jgi:hypothetical protein
LPPKSAEFCCRSLVQMPLDVVISWTPQGDTNNLTAEPMCFSWCCRAD